jgi:hypothetical protein
MGAGVMARRKPPVPASEPSADSVELTNPETGERVPTRDMREEIARRSASQRGDPAAERAFVESKIEMIRTHPRLSDAEKQAAIAELEDKLNTKP